MNDCFDCRTSGVLLHPTSLPGAHGVGDLGPAAHAFAEFLARAGQSWWQMLPVGPPGVCNSPYDSPSTFAGSPLLVSLEMLAHEGLLRNDAIVAPRVLAGRRARYLEAARFRDARLRLAFACFDGRASPADLQVLEAFRTRSSTWLPDYALFCALKHAYRGAPWMQWDRDLSMHKRRALEQARRQLAEEIRFHEFVQLKFDEQWRGLRRHCHRLGVRLLGDVPMFVAHDGADVWANQRFFLLDAAGRPTVVAGVPPDKFNSAGQSWGNPLYRWPVMKRRGYEWWIRRFTTTLDRFDAARLDHFIGFYRTWEIPANARTAVRGRFVTVPGEELLAAVRQAVGGLPLVAENLGALVPGVEALRSRFGLPGMRVLQFAFDSDEPNDHQPHRYLPRSIVYTGTHDNDTTASWFHARGPDGAARRRRTQRYLGDNSVEPTWALIGLALASVANTAIIPLQDLLGLGASARMNTPGSPLRNWEWRCGTESMSPRLADRIRTLCDTYERIPRSVSRTVLRGG